MSTRQSIQWFDMIVGDPDAVSRFYEEVAGLEREPVDEGGGHTSYSLRDEAGREVLGICDEGVFPGWVRGWLPYLEIGDFDSRVGKVEGAGGVALHRMTMNHDWKGQRFCLVRDPSGAPFMLCEARTSETGFTRPGESLG